MVPIVVFLSMFLESFRKFLMKTLVGVCRYMYVQASKHTCITQDATLIINAKESNMTTIFVHVCHVGFEASKRFFLQFSKKVGCRTVTIP